MHGIEAQGVRVPALGFGTWRLYGEECRAAVAHALAVGYRHIDTAQMYANEDEVGEAVQAASVPRDEVWMTTKLATNNHRTSAVKQSTEDSLARLRTDYVDLLLIHWPSRDVPHEETLGAMHELRAAGKVRTVGVSNFPPSHLQAALSHGPILTNQVEHHPYLSQDDLLDLCRQHDGFLTAYAPLAKGRVLEDPVIVEIAEAHGAEPAQVAIAWALGHERLATIPKATAPARIETNLGGSELRLSGEEHARITALDRGPAGRLVGSPSLDWER